MNHNKGENEFALLDHGSVDLVTSWGTDEDIIEAARMSTGKGFKGWDAVHTDDCARRNLARPSKCDSECHPGDAKLLKYLYTHKHMTPFEMCGLVIEVQAPIFVFREWHRHRTQSYNEMSARYIPLPDVNYVPNLDNLMERAIAAQDSSNSQARAANARGEPVEASDFKAWLSELEDAYDIVQGVYARGLRIGVPKELARLPVPVARYSRMRASANLRNWLGFLSLRMDTSAQWEIRQYANVVSELVKQHFPRTWALVMEVEHES